MARTFDATDLRDKIYALLGLTSDGAEIVPIPNYSQDTQIVFSQTARSIILQQKILAYLFEYPNSSWGIVFKEEVELDWTDFENWN